jgi:hypothetical protein
MQLPIQRHVSEHIVPTVNMQAGACAKWLTQNVQPSALCTYPILGPCALSDEVVVSAYTLYTT